MNVGETLGQGSQEEAVALHAGALSWAHRKQQRWGHLWREDGAFDWTGCDAVEVIVGKVSGVPLLAGTRMPADSVLQHFEWDESPQDIAEQFCLNLQQVLAVLRFAGVLEQDSMAA